MSFKAPMPAAIKLHKRLFATSARPCTRHVQRAGSISSSRFFVLLTRSTRGAAHRGARRM